MSTCNDLICLVSHGPELRHPGSESHLSPSPTPALGGPSTARLDSLCFSCSPAYALTLHICQFAFSFRLTIPLNFGGDALVLSISGL